MTDHAAETPDDTVERGLADDLLGPGSPTEVEVEVEADTVLSAPVPAVSTSPDLDDDEDYLAPAARRGKLTTALLVALIFVVGVLVGAILTKTLSPAPAPPIVYVLNDAGSSAPSATPSAPR